MTATSAPAISFLPTGLATISHRSGRLEKVGPAAVLGRKPVLGWRPRALEPVPGAPTIRRAERGGLSLEWVVQVVDDAVECRVSLHNGSSLPVVVDTLSPLCVVGTHGLDLPGRASDWRFFRNGHQSWSGTKAWRMHEADEDPPLHLLRLASTDPTHRSPGTAGRYRSDLVGAVSAGPSGAGSGIGSDVGSGAGLNAGLCVGFLGATRQFSAIELDARGGRFRRLEATCDLDGTELAPGQTMTSEPVQVRFGDDPCDLLASWAADLGRRMGARVPERPPSGWCSWYYYFTKVTEADVRENLAALQSRRDRIPLDSLRPDHLRPDHLRPDHLRPDHLRPDHLRLDYLMVDDGHQKAIGDWLVTNEKFPSGMPALATDIQDAGLDAGLWLAPFLADPRSQLARDNPDWFVRNRRGRPVTAIFNPGWSRTRRMWALDTTRPDVLEWLRHLASVAHHEWGFRILKLDFLYAAGLRGRRARDLSRGTALRMGLEALRAGAGEDAFLLGCGCPMGQAVGIVDAMRIGPDVAPFWASTLTRSLMRDQHGVSTRHAIRNALTRSFMHGRLWANDPDCLMIRRERTRLSEDEVRALASVVGLTDGMLVLSDRLEGVPDDRLAVAEAALSMQGGAVRVPDLFESDLPETIVSDRGDEVLVGVANWQDSPEDRVVDLHALLGPSPSPPSTSPRGPSASRTTPSTVTETWSGRVLEVRDGLVDVGRLAPHSVVVLRCRPESSGRQDHSA